MWGGFSLPTGELGVTRLPSRKSACLYVAVRQPDESWIAPLAYFRDDAAADAGWRLLQELAGGRIQS